MDCKAIKIEDFDYELANERIAKYPLEKRDESRLLVWRNNAVEEHRFYDIPDLLESDDVLVYNNTKVIQARLHFKKETGAVIEVFCLEPVEPADYLSVFQTNSSCVWKCMVGNRKQWKEGELIQQMCVRREILELRAERVGCSEGMTQPIRFSWDDSEVTFADILAHLGELPIPPYLNRATEQKDKETYQTVYSKIDGSVAAPTAGLHFTKDVLRLLALKGVREDEVTLHVGAGTFHPVKSECIGDHAMHREVISVDKRTIQDLINNPGKVVAVGTTSVRTLESLYYIGCRLLDNPQGRDFTVHQWEPYECGYSHSTMDALQSIVDYLDKIHMPSLDAATEIMIVPGFEFRVVSKMITNFHQPKSTLLLLVSAFVGLDNWKRVYNYALEHDFRFLSYGDSSLLFRS